MKSFLLDILSIENNFLKMTDHFKIVLLGEGGVGKTTFAKRLCEGQFDTRYIATVGVDIYHYTCNDIIFDIWDTAGQEKFGGLQDGYYFNADGLIVMFDLSRDLKVETQHVFRWVDGFKRVCEKLTFPIIIVGHKPTTHVPTIVSKMMYKLKKTYPNETFAYVSLDVKTGYNIKVPFNIMFGSRSHDSENDEEEIDDEETDEETDEENYEKTDDEETSSDEENSDEFEEYTREDLIAEIRSLRELV